MDLKAFNINSKVYMIMNIDLDCLLDLPEFLLNGFERWQRLDCSFLVIVQFLGIRGSIDGDTTLRDTQN